MTPRERRDARSAVNEIVDRPVRDGPWDAYLPLPLIAIKDTLFRPSTKSNWRRQRLGGANQKQEAHQLFLERQRDPYTARDVAPYLQNLLREIQGMNEEGSVNQYGTG